MAKKRYITVIDIGSALLKVIVLDTATDKLKEAVIKDLAAIKDDKSRDVYIINTLKNTLHQDILRSSTSFLCLSDETVHIRRIELPRMPVNEISDALKWRVRGIVPFDIDKAVLDFDILGEVQDEEGTKKLDIIMAAMPKDIIDKKVLLLKEAGLDISGVNVDSFGLSSIINQMPYKEKGESCAVLKIDLAKSTINIYRDSKLIFVRNIPVGLNNITEAIKSPVVTDKGPVEISADELTKLKTEIGIPDNKDILLDGKIQGKHILAMLRPVAEYLCSEVSRSFDYYSAQLGGKEITRLYLIGDGSNYKNLDRFIKELLGIETEYLKYQEKETIKIMPQIITLIGVAKGGVDAKVNLLPVEYRMEKMQRVERISIRMAGFAILTILLVSFILVKARVNDYKSRLASARSKMKILQEIKVLYDQTSEREEFVNAVRSLEVPTVSILKELSNIVPDNIMLSNLVIDQKSGTIRFNGVVYLGAYVGEVILTDFMDDMENSPYFKTVNLESSQKGTLEGKDVALFSISSSIQK